MGRASTLRALPILLGAGAGATLAVAGVLFVGRSSAAGVPLGSPVVVAIATPGAHVVSWVLGWPLQQEAALACYALGFLFTVAIAGGIAGGSAGALLGHELAVTRRDRTDPRLGP